MNNLTKKLPVKIYQWDDADAPILDGNKDCVSTIFKACLVTGYGSKKSAGWTLPFEDIDSGIKVFNPPKSAETDFYLRVSADDGRQLVPQVFLNMSDIDKGDLTLQCETEFKYGTGKFNGKWLLIATERAFWFFTGNKRANDLPSEHIGSYFYCGDTIANTIGQRGIYLKYTGGSWNIHDDDRYSIFFKQHGSGAVIGKLYNPQTNSVADVNPQSLFHGDKNLSTETVASPLYLSAFAELWGLPAVAPSTNRMKNFEQISDGYRTFINHAHALIRSETNLYIPIDYWEL